MDGPFELKACYFIRRSQLIKWIAITTDGFAFQVEALVKLLIRVSSFSEPPVRIGERRQGKSAAMSTKNQIAILIAILHIPRTAGPKRMFARRRADGGAFASQSER